MIQRPTKADVLALLEERRLIFARMHQEMRIDMDFYYWSSDYQNAFAVNYLNGLPKGFKPKLPPLAQIGVSVGLNQIMVGETPTVTVALPESLHRQEERREEQRDMLRAWLQGFLYALDTYSTESPLRDFVAKSLSLGLGVLSYNIAWDRLPDPPHGYGRDGKPRMGRTAQDRESYLKWRQQRDMAFPFHVRSLHPLTVFLDPHHDPPEDYIIEEWVLASYAARQHPEIDIPPVGGSGTSRRVTYCSADWYGVWLNEQPLLTAEDGADIEGVAPNPLGRPWYRMAWGGFGDRDDRGNYEHRGKGIIRDGRDIIRMKVVNLNIMDAMKQMLAFPPLEVHGGSAEERRRVMEELEFGPGVVIETPENVVVRAIQSPAVPPVVFQQQEEVNALLEMQFGPEILRGIYRDDTASGQRTRLAQAKAPYRAAKYNCEQAVAAMLQDILYMIKNELEEPVTVVGKAGGSDTSLTLRPQDIPDGVIIKVDFSPPTDDERAFKRQEGIQDLQAGVLSLEGYIGEYRGEEDAAERLKLIRVERLTEQILQNPAVQELLVKQIVGQQAPSAAGQGGDQVPAGVPAPGGNGQLPAAVPTPPTQPATPPPYFAPPRLS